MSEKIQVQAIGSYYRINAPNPSVIAEYNLNIAARVFDAKGSPVSGLASANFEILISGLTPSLLGGFTVNESPTATDFPGFYHLNTRYIPQANAILSIDWLLTEGALLCLKVKHNADVGTALVSLTPLLGDSSA